MKPAYEKFQLFMDNKNSRTEELKKLTEGQLTLEYDVTFRYNE
jgi:hypothetical protein